MSCEREDKLLQAGFALSKAAPPKAKYALLKRVGPLLYSAGALPAEKDNLVGVGKVGVDIAEDQAAEMAALAAANIIRAVHAAYGSLDVIKQVVKVTGFVNSAPDFTHQHIVLNGASSLLLDVFGAAGVHSRSAVGVAALPFNACVEVEILFELTDDANEKVYE